MTEAEWLAGENANQMIQFFWNRPHSARKLRLLSVACCRLYWEKVPEEGRRWVELAEEVAEKGLGGDSFLDQRREAHSRAQPVAKKSLELAAEPLAADPCVAAMNAEFTLRGRKRAGLIPALIHDIFGNVFRPGGVEPDWVTWNHGTVRKLAQSIYDERGFDQL